MATMVLCIFSISSSFAQIQAVTGTVTDVNGEPLPGVNVVQKGTTNGVSADFDGNYAIRLIPGSRVIIFSSIGFNTKEVTVNASNINVTLDEDTQSLDEVVVVGYGTQKKANLTGAVSVATAEVLQNRAIANVGEGLQGVVPGLNVTVTSGDPTEGPEFNIRGFESINGGSPLILVDGVPMDLNRINPENIESVNVLKDGASAAIYGARAAFGVILVKTKEGSLGKTNVQLSTQLSWNKPIFNINQIDNGYIYALERNKAQERNGGDPRYDEAYLQGLQQYWADPANNAPWEVIDGSFVNYENPGMVDDLVNATSPRQKIDLTISGATEKTNYFTSFGLFNTDGFYNHPANDNFKRYNILAKADYKLTDWLTFDSQITANFENSDKPAAVDINTLIRIEPIRPYRVPLIPGYEQYEGMSWNHAFPIYAQLENGGRTKFTTQDIWLRGGLVANPIKNLTLNGNFSYNTFTRQFESFRPAYEVVSFNLEQDNPVQVVGDDDIEIQRNFNQYYVLNLFGEYELDSLDDHYIKMVFGYNQEWDFNQRIAGDANQLVSPNIIDIGATTGNRFIEGGKGHATLRGYFYRLNYIYKDKYLLEASTRYDGTSRFPAGDRFGLFPSISAGWRISNENFMSGTREWLDNLKLRASYGELGNQLLGSGSQLLGNDSFYPYIPSLSVGTSNNVLSSGLIPTVGAPGLVSPSLTWERVVSTNLGLDVVMFKNKLDMSFDVYTRETLDMLLRRAYPDVLGAAAPRENGADLKTQGWEASIKWRDKIGDNISYFINLNVADWTSEITKYDNPTGAIPGNPSNGNALSANASSNYYEGQQIGEIWGYETVGIFQGGTDEEVAAFNESQSRLGNGWRAGDIQFRDLNGDGEISPGINTLDDPGDRRIIGNTTPRYTYGINTGISYKGFSIDAFFQGVGKRDYYPGNQNWTWFFPWRSYNGDESWLTNTWTPDNPNAYFPEIQTDAKNYTEQTRFLQNAAYIRLKNLNVGYAFPTSITDKIGLSSFRLYVAGQNVWEYSKIRKPLDPEYIFDNSIDFPLLRTYSVGMVLGF
ncbi:TonB-dependent receptor [Flagellimonas eckloniae]|uniref:TonB-dependent receptor n=2 Tax=Flagellimonas eckloniae TaxID=346185 RepID=A0A0Q1HEE1_9FLAO|nr:TonB-dependent receptor [Allomuricauda eckloniae]